MAGSSATTMRPYSSRLSPPDPCAPPQGIVIVGGELPVIEPAAHPFWQVLEAFEIIRRQVPALSAGFTTIERYAVAKSGIGLPSSG